MIKTLIPVFALGTAIAVYFMFISPKLDEVKLLQEEEAQFDTALAQTLEIDRMQERLESQFNELPKKDLAKLEKLLPEEIDPVRLVYDIDNIASAHGKHLENVNVTRDNKVATQEKSDQSEIEPGTISVTFTINATYTELLNFVRDLERSLQIVDISSINFSVSEEASSGGDSISRNIVLRVYSL